MIHPVLENCLHQPWMLLDSSQKCTGLWHSIDCEEACSPAGAKNQNKNKKIKKIIIMNVKISKNLKLREQIF